MASRREDVDLEIVLQDPKCARLYVESFVWDCAPAPEYIVYGIDQKIWFKNMTDDEAVTAALTILRDIEIPRVWRESKLLEFSRH